MEPQVVESHLVQLENFISCYYSKTHGLLEVHSDETCIITLSRIGPHKDWQATHLNWLVDKVLRPNSGTAR